MYSGLRKLLHDLECFSRSDVELLVAILAAIAAVLVIPEVREFLRLGTPQGGSQQRRSKRIMMFVIFMIIWTIIGAVIWAFVCPYFMPGVEEPKPKPPVISQSPSPSPARIETPPPSPSPTPIGPITPYPPVILEGAQFRLYVFTQEYHWRKGTIEVEFNKKVVSANDMISYLSKIHGDLKSADALVCVGTASKDLEDNEAGEEDRALMRALQLIIWARKALKHAKVSPDLHALNLGHYRMGVDRDEQRLIIIFGVKKIEPTADVDRLLSPKYSETLKAKLKEKNFGFDFDAYSKFDPQKRS